MMGDIVGLILLFRVPAKTMENKGASHHPAYMGSYYSHAFLFSLIQVLLQGNENVGSDQDFILLSLCLV